MQFCPKCGSLLKAKKEKGEDVLYCSCGYSSKGKAGSIKEEVKEEVKDIEIVEEEEKVLPLTEAECPGCGHDKAYYWLVQTRAGDEPETKFLRCEKCGHTWRDYS